MSIFPLPGNPAADFKDFTEVTPRIIGGEDMEPHAYPFIIVTRVEYSFQGHGMKEVPFTTSLKLPQCYTTIILNQEVQDICNVQFQLHIVLVASNSQS